MSLQYDFERCLGYAEKLEDRQERRVNAQNNIIFVRNESERLKNKLKICGIVAAVSAAAFLLLIFNLIGGSADWESLVAFLLVATVAGVVSSFNYVKTKKESDELEAKKVGLIQQYTADAQACEIEIGDLIGDIYREDLLDIVPEEYFYTEAIEFCLLQIRKKLATTTSEAFMLLDNEIKRSEQMAYLEQLNNARMEQLNEIKRAIEVNTLVTLAEQNRDRSN